MIHGAARRLQFDAWPVRTVRKEAERALRDAGALGVFPTPLDRIMVVANVVEVKEDVLNQSFLERVRAAASKAGQAVRQATTSGVNKVLGLFTPAMGLCSSAAPSSR